MSKKTRIGLIVMLTAILLLALTVPGLAKKHDPVKITVTITEGLALTTQENEVVLEKQFD